jgi:hypothetical protein
MIATVAIPLKQGFSTPASPHSQAELGYLKLSIVFSQIIMRKGGEEKANYSPGETAPKLEDRKEGR